MSRATLTRLILFFLCLPGFIAAGWRISLRWQAESRDIYVETVMDFDELRMLSRTEGWKLRDVLLAVAERGASSVGISEDTLSSLETEGRLSILDFSDIRQMALEGKNSSYENMLSEPQGVLWIWSRESALLDRIEHNLYWKLPADKLKRVNTNLLLLRKSGEDFKTRVGLGFSQEYLNLAKECGLGIVLRIYNYPGLSAGSIRAIISDLPNPSEVSAIVFAEEEVLGNRGALTATVDELLRRSFRIGLVEFNDQAGMETILAALREKVPFVRVHSIGRRELDEHYNISRAIARWIRAVRERRIKMLYMRCFFQDKKKFIGDLVRFNLNYLELLTGRLIDDGFKIPRNDEQRRDEPRHLVGKASPAERLAIGLALMMGVPLLVSALKVRYIREYHIWITAAAAFLAYGLLPVRTFVAFAGLLGAIAWSTLGCVRAMAALDRELERKENVRSLFTSALWFFLRLFVPSFVGGTLIAALHAETIYLLKFEQFRGIKLAFIIPVVISGLWALRRYGGGALAILTRPLTARELFIGCALTVGIALYLLRSGNVTFLKPSEAEDSIRTFFENLLIARPRNKEFLIGYPAAVFFLFFRRRKMFEILPVMALLMQMGQVSALNTFCHFHSPLFLAYLRGFNGIWTGLSVGIALLCFYLACRIISFAGCKKERNLLVGYFGFQNFGDELLWRTFLTEAEKRRPDLKWSILWGSDDWKGPETVEPVMRRDVLNVFENVAAARAVVVPGGSLLQAYTSLGSLLYYSTLLMCGRLLGAKLILIGQGFGPWGKPGSGYRMLAAGAVRIVLEFCDYISCRDAQALNTLSRLPGPSLKAHKGADIVFLRVSELNLDGRFAPSRIGCVLRSSQCGKKAVECLAEIAAKERYEIIPLAFQKIEDERAWQYSDRYKNTTVVTLSEFTEAAKYILECNLIVTMRMHAAVVASMLGTPWIGINVDPKISGLAEELDWRFILKADELDAEHLEVMIKQMENERPSLSKKLSEAAVEAAARASVDLDRALAVLKKRPA